MILTLPDLITPEEIVLIKQKLAAVPFADGKATADLATNDPYKGLAPSPLIPDDSWVALQGICGG